MARSQGVLGGTPLPLPGSRHTHGVRYTIPGLGLSCGPLLQASRSVPLGRSGGRRRPRGLMQSGTACGSDSAPDRHSRAGPRRTVENLEDFTRMEGFPRATARIFN